MSKPAGCRPALIIWAVTYQPEKSDLKNILNVATKDLGRVISASRLYSFDQFSQYYSDEMGTGLLKRLFAFEKIQDQAALVEIKHKAFALEQEFSADGKRTANIDPATLSEGNFILSTFKYAAHRPYIGNGVYADLTLIYKNGEFLPLEWTYPDYREDNIWLWLKNMRDFLIKSYRRSE